MKLVRSLLTAAFIAVLSASFSWGQCCGGASYGVVGSTAAADGCGSYTVMRTQRRVVYDRQEVTRHRTVTRLVWEEKQVPVCRTVRETCYRTHEYQVRVPIREMSTKTVQYTVRRPVREMQTRTVNYTVRVPVTEQHSKEIMVRRPVTEQQTREITVNVRRRVTEQQMRTVTRTVRVPYTETQTVTVRGGHWETRQEVIPGRTVSRLVRVPGSCVTDPCTGCPKWQRGCFQRVCCQLPDRVVCRRCWVPTCETKEICVTKYRCETVCE
ncbi:MAG TPA: hypothetical protein PKD54_07945, partial [Pirellulaceae bacterium]|nr:hypothetical protein [Pirellulaceae bacterium]